MVEKVIQIKYGVTLNVDVSAKISEKKSCVWKILPLES